MHLIFYIDTSRNPEVMGVNVTEKVNDHLGIHMHLLSQFVLIINRKLKFYKHPDNYESVTLITIGL